MPEAFILQRHKLIDHLLRLAIENHGIETVVEIAAGMSPRGYQFKKEYGERIDYIEADLPGMTMNKRRVLEKAGMAVENQKVVAVDVKIDAGPLSMEESIVPLLGSGPVAIITEGLVNYFPRDEVLKIWERFAALARSSALVYLTDLHMQSTTPSDVFARAWRNLIRLFTRGETYLQFSDGSDARKSLMDAGFTHARLHDPCDYEEALGLSTPKGRGVVHVLEGRVFSTVCT